jgi:2-oxoglutarate dehydrogenase E2 component (dihydrolipoamide succinyltransferase)
LGEASSVTQGFVAVEADYEGVVRARRSGAATSAEAEGIVLDDAVFAVRAAVEALAQFPELNASVGEMGIEAHHERNVGVAIDVDGRLLVPVIAGAQDLNLRGLSRRLGELLGRAQAGELAVDDLLGGTFTVAAAPSERVLVSIPGLVEPQVAILSVGGVTRRAVVLTDEQGFDSIAVRSVGVLGLGFDVRVIDATIATRFLERVAELLGSQDWSTEL